MLLALTASGAKEFSRSAIDFSHDIRLGINIGNTFDVPSGNETEWGNSRVTRSLVRLYKSKGINAVRLPVTWRKQFDVNDPKHEISPAFMDRVQDVVDICLSEGMIVVLNIHHDGGSEGWPREWLTIDGVHEDDADKVLADIWRQIALRFRDYGERLVFEGFNEIRKAKSHPGEDGGQAGQDDWGGKALYCKTANRYAKTFYDTVRATGGKNRVRYLIIPTYAAAYTDIACREWQHPNPADNRVMVSVHVYEPGWFCLWGDETHYDREKFTQRFKEVFPMLKEIFTDRKIGIVIDEVNAERRYRDKTKTEPNDEDRVKWAKHYAYVARRFGYPFFIWESGGSEVMGLVDRKNIKWTHPEVIDAFNAGISKAEKREVRD